MISKTSLFKKSLIINNIKRFWWVSVIYGLFLFFVMPLDHMMRDITEYDEWQGRRLLGSLHIDSNQNGLQILLLIVIPVILAALIFRYMHTGKSATFMHSIPCNRTTLYYSHNAAGIILLIAPILINAIILVILQITTNLSMYYSIINILEWVGITLLFAFLFYSSAVFVGMFTGSSAAQIVFTYILNFLPAAIYIFIDYNANQLLYGYVGARFNATSKFDIPIIRLLNFHLESFALYKILIYFILTVILYIAGNYVYKIRDVEVAGDLISFKFIKPVFKYGVTGCGMLLAGLYFASLGKGTVTMLLTGYFIGAFLGYWISEMLIQKSFRVWNKYKGFLGYLIIILILIIGLKNDITGFERRIPDISQVEKVYFGNDYYTWNQVVSATTVSLENEEKATDIIKYNPLNFFEEEENIKSIIRIHEYLISDRQYERTYNTPIYYIIYTLKSGRHIMREYNIDQTVDTPFLRPIYESIEYKMGRYPIIEQQNNDINWIEIKDDRTNKKPVMITNMNEISEFAKLLRQELINTNYEELLFNDKEIIRIRINSQEDTIHHYILRDAYSEIIDWLKLNNYYNDIVAQPEEIVYVVLRKTYDSKTTNKTEEKSVEIREAEVLKELLENHVSNYRGEHRDMIYISFHCENEFGTYSFNRYIDSNIVMSSKLNKYIQEVDNL